jgi:molybdopterin-synthase adenylyltransferase
VGQERLARSTVVVVGCGALGTASAAALARAGVGRLRVVDRDFIELHNLQRQMLFDEEDVRQQLPKAVAAERHLQRANSAIAVQGVVADASCRNIESLVADADVIVDGLDNLETRYLLNDVAWKLGKPWVYGAAVSSYGMTMTFVPGKTPCLRCVFPELPSAEQGATCDTAGVVSAAPLAIGALQSAEAIKLIVGAELSAPGLRYLDVWTATLRSLAMPEAQPGCPACSGVYDFLEARRGAQSVTLCGQNAVQIVPASEAPIALEEFACRLRQHGEVTCNEFMLRFCVAGYELTLFPDGRAIIKGTPDPAIARSLYAKYVGM